MNATPRLVAAIEKQSGLYNGDGHTNYPYAFGVLKSVLLRVELLCPEVTRILNKEALDKEIENAAKESETKMF